MRLNCGYPFPRSPHRGRRSSRPGTVAAVHHSRQMRTSPATQSRIIMHVEEVDHYRDVRYGNTVVGKISAHTSAVRCGSGNIGTRQLRRARTDDLRGPVYPALPSFSWRLSWLRVRLRMVTAKDGNARHEAGLLAGFTAAQSGSLGRRVPGRQRRQVRRPWFTQTRTCRPPRAAGSRASPGRSR
jgi:hypothetical protein